MLDLSKNNFAIDEDIYLGDQFSICERCREKLKHSPGHPISTSMATSKLEGKLSGQKVFKAGNFTLCSECVKDIYDKLYAVDAGIESISDEEIEEKKGKKK